MKCAVCVAEGKTSRIYQGAGIRTAMGSEHYYDEEGVWHNHDPNTTSWEMTCSNGHRWSLKVKHTCCPAPQCRWNAK